MIERNTGNTSFDTTVRRPDSGSRYPMGVDADHHYYSPKKVATAIGVSESSLKRWCDAGYVKAYKTAGGHRRVHRAEVISFVKRKSIKLRDPLSIGLPDIRTVSFDSIESAKQQLLEALKSSDELAARKIMVALFVEGRNMAEIFDRVISPVFAELGSLWECGKLEIFEERVACQICMKSLVDIESLVPQVPEDAPLAIGASLENDHYQIASTGIELCLRNFGWNARSLGANIPIESLLTAVHSRKPSLVWISVSHIDNVDAFKQKLAGFCSQLPPGQRVVIGGNAVAKNMLPGLPNVRYCENFAQLIMSTRVR